jgi:hypothetical protein
LKISLEEIRSSTVGTLSGVSSETSEAVGLLAINTAMIVSGLSSACIAEIVEEVEVSLTLSAH